MKIKTEIAILAGGRSSRFGSNKATADWFGRPVISAMVERLRSITERIFIIANDPAPYRFLHLPIEPDIFPGCGPLSGLHAALCRAVGPGVSLVACDMPLVEPRLLLHLVELADQEGYRRPVMVERKGRLEPFYAFYPKGLAPEAEQLLREGRCMGLQRFVQRFRPWVVVEAEAARFCPDLSCLESANTPEELDRLKRVAQAGQSGLSGLNQRNPSGKGPKWD